MKGKILGCDRFGCVDCSGRFLSRCDGQVEPRFVPMHNPFFDFGPNLIGANWMDFWLLCEREWAEHEKKCLAYGPTKCAFCIDWYACPDCPVRLDAELVQEAEDRAEAWEEA